MSKNNCQEVQNTVKVFVDADRELGPISPALYGVNHRYFNHGVGMWDAEKGEAKSVFDEIYSKIGFKSLRYPGGTVGNTFDWKVSLGPPEQRKNVVHGHKNNLSPQATDFGVDEAARFCEKHGTEMVYVYNMANGSAQDAANLVEYLNAPDDGKHPWAALRTQNGHREPYNVKYFEMGNEMFFRGQRYWLAGKSDKPYQEVYAHGGTISFEDQGVVFPDDWRQSAAVSNGSVCQVRFIRFAPIVEGSAEIFVNGEKWTGVKDLSAHGKENVYHIDDESGKITFGDGLNGNIPPSGYGITANYVIRHEGFVDFYAAMKAVDPTINILPCLEDSAFLDAMGSEHLYDGIAMHPYVWRMPKGISIEDYHDNIMQTTERNAYMMKELMESVRKRVGDERFEKMKFPCTEYGILANCAPVDHYLLSLDHGLFIARSFINFMEINVPFASKHCLIDYQAGDSLGPGEQAVIGQEPDFLVTATARVFEMFIHMFGNTRVLSVTPDAPVKQINNKEYLDALKMTGGVNIVNENDKDNIWITHYAQEHMETDGLLGILKVGASRDDDGNLYIMAINCDREDEISAVIDISGFPEETEGEVWVLNGPDYLSFNTLESPDTVSIHKHTIRKTENRLELLLPAHSVTAVKLYKTS